MKPSQGPQGSVGSIPETPPDEAGAGWEKAPRKRFAKRMRAKREELGWSQRELARQANVEASFLRVVERGSNNISISKAEGIATALGLRLHEMVAEGGDGPA